MEVDRQNLPLEISLQLSEKHFILQVFLSQRNADVSRSELKDRQQSIRPILVWSQYTED